MVHTRDPQPEARIVTTDGAMLCAPTFAAQVCTDWFEPRHWSAAGIDDRGGRGTVWFVRGPFGAAVLRHYRRGGVVARLSRDRYLWQGEARTRSFAEFRLLQQLRAQGLPVPQAIACRYRRNGMVYTADLLTAEIAGARTLAQLLPDLLNDLAGWDALGATLARFHSAGLCHADLNAHNLLRDAAACWWLIDFDRGRLRPPQRAWQQQRLQRLQRSLLKLGAATSNPWAAVWLRLINAHDQALAKGAP